MLRDTRSSGSNEMRFAGQYSIKFRPRNGLVVVFSSTCTQIQGYCLKIGYDRFFLHFSLFTLLSWDSAE